MTKKRCIFYLAVMFIILIFSLVTFVNYISLKNRQYDELFANTSKLIDNVKAKTDSLEEANVVKRLELLVLSLSKENAGLKEQVLKLQKDLAGMEKNCLGSASKNKFGNRGLLIKNGQSQ